MSDSTNEIRAMDSLRESVNEAGFKNGKCFAYSRNYLSWETNKVIQMELYRNLGLAFIAVFVVTLVLIANLWTCTLVATCVIFTLVNMGGTLYFWGLTIDTVTSVMLILAIGLAIDYSAHVGHTFMTINGTRNERALKTLGDIGPAVFNGGFSTFLAFILLAGSNSYVFQTFFKSMYSVYTIELFAFNYGQHDRVDAVLVYYIMSAVSIAHITNPHHFYLIDPIVFFSVVVYGLFHGLIYLPVILSWIGPAPYLSAEEPEVLLNAIAMENAKKGKLECCNVIVNDLLNEKLMDNQIPGPPPDYDVIGDDAILLSTNLQLTVERSQYITVL